MGVTPEWLKEQYEKIYRATDIVHPRIGPLPPYGGPSSGRDNRTMKIVRSLLVPGKRVLDASTGRGTVLRMLIDAGYYAHGTDIASVLFEPGGDLHDLPATRVDYASITKAFPARSFDMVISNDVLEHLAGCGEVDEALDNLASLSRGYLLVSVGLKYAVKYPSALKLKMQCLHRVRKPGDWWSSRFEQVADIERQSSTNTNWWGYGKVRT